MKTDFLAIAVGIMLCYCVGRRRFNRRNVAGLQVYQSYERGMFTYGIESLLKLWGVLCILAGIAGEALRYFIHH